MKEKIKKIIKIIFGTQNNLLLKLNCSLFISAILFLIFSITIKEQNNPQAYNIFLYMSAILFGVCLALIQNNSIWEILKELFRLYIFFIMLILSLNFCINSSINLYDNELIIGSIASCIFIIICSFYLIAKFIDIFVFVKKVFRQIKQKLFNSTQPTTSKVKALIENITAFLVSIAGLGIAIKTIIEPLINLFK